MSDQRLPDIQDRLREEVDLSWQASTLSEWMAQHRADVQDLLARGLDWDAAARHFNAAGLKGPGGSAPTGSTAAETWRRLALVRQTAPRAKRAPGAGRARGF